jgi:nucleotide-binding universal stress UspA family protein
MNIFLPLATYPDPVDEGHLGAALAVAHHLEAGLTGAGVEVEIPQVKNKLAEVILHLRDQIRAAEQASQAHAARLLQRLSSLAASAGVKVSLESFRATPAFLDEAIASHARFHDAVILPAPKGDVAARATAEAVIFGSGRPVVLLPGPGGVAAPRLDTIVLATDFGRVATRALFDARPFLTRAGKIVAVTVTGEKDVSQGNRAALAAHFARLGLAAEVVQFDAGDQDVGDALQDYVDRLGGGMLVMGAFGHSRVRDFVLGGVTRSVLFDLRHPVLMSC